MRRHRPLLLLPALLPALAGVLAATQAHAETSPYYLGVSQSIAHDSNLLRLSENQATPAGVSKSDTIYSTALLAGIDQPIGRQRLFGNVSLRNNRLSSNDIYNNQSYSLTAGLDWETINNISGNVKAVANRNLASFNNVEIGVLTKKNLETTQQLDAAFRIGMVTAWTAEVNVGWRSVDYTAVEYASREFRQNSVSAGLRYKPSAVSNFGVALRTASGKYPHFRALGNGSFEADSYDRRDIDFTAAYLPSGASDYFARLSFGKTQYDVATQRDFSGVTGLLRWNWRPTGKLRFAADLSRDPSQDSYFLASQISNATLDYSRITNALQLRSDYDVTGKIAVNAALTYARRSLTRTVPLATGINDRATSDEREANLSAGITWAPLRSVLVGCNLGRLQRNGDAPLSSDLQDTTYSCYGQFTLR